MEIQQMIEEYQKVLNELNRKHQKQCHKDLILMFSLFMLQFPFSVSGAFGYIRFMPLLLLSSVICAFNVGMAYQRYLDANGETPPTTKVRGVPHLISDTLRITESYILG